MDIRASAACSCAMSGPLDFEGEDLLLQSPPASTKRKKVISLDDLLTDYYKQREIDSNACKKSNDSKRYSSDDEVDKNEKDIEAKFSEIADGCEKQMNRIVTDNEIPLWGLEIFGQQKFLPSSSFIVLENSKLLRHLRENELDLDLLLDPRQGAGETYLEGLLINGWLLQLSFISGFVEASVASWTFYQALYCSNEELQSSACDFWCSILLSEKEVGQPSIVLEWIPSFHQLKEALEVYGYLFDTSQNVALNSISSFRVPDIEGPPVNISSWIKITSACFQIRKFQSVFSTSEAEEVLVVIIHLFLARQLQGLSFILTECMESILSFFNEDEWAVSCEKVAHAIAYRVPKDLNSLRVVECISGIGPRNKHLRDRMAIHLLGILLEKNVSDGKGILKSLLSVKVKDKNTDFFTLYIYLVLSENWLLSYDLGEERSDILSMWTKFLRNCSCNISSTDWRLYASKVRSKASYLLLQSSIIER